MGKQILLREIDEKVWDEFKMNCLKDKITLSKRVEDLLKRHNKRRIKNV